MAIAAQITRSGGLRVLDYLAHFDTIKRHAISRACTNHPACGPSRFLRVEQDHSRHSPRFVSSCPTRTRAREFNLAMRVKGGSNPDRPSFDCSALKAQAKTGAGSILHLRWPHCLSLRGLLRCPLPM
jgi:hypothetical protein